MMTPFTMEYIITADDIARGFQGVRLLASNNTVDFLVHTITLHRPEPLASFERWSMDLSQMTPWRVDNATFPSSLPSNMMTGIYPLLVDHGRPDTGTDVRVVNSPSGTPALRVQVGDYWAAGVYISAQQVNFAPWDTVIVTGRMGTIIPPGSGWNGAIELSARAGSGRGLSRAAISDVGAGGEFRIDLTISPSQLSDIRYRSDEQHHPSLGIIMNRPENFVGAYFYIYSIEVFGTEPDIYATATVTTSAQRARNFNRDNRLRQILGDDWESLVVTIEDTPATEPDLPPSEPEVPDYDDDYDSDYDE